MRYLFGDSVPFQLQYNFLTTLEIFVACAAQAVEREFEIQELMVSTADAAAARARSLEEIEVFHASVTEAIRGCASKSMSPVAADYTQKVLDHAGRLVEDVRRGYAQTTDREQTSTRAEIDRRRAEIRSSLETFLTTGRLPTVESKVSMRLEGGHNEFTAVLNNPLKITTSFKLGSAQVQAWGAPRKVSEFAQGIAPQIGVKKSWITRKVQPEVVLLDDFFLGGFELSGDTATIRLRKKPDLKDSLVFKLRRTDTELLGEVQRPDEEPADGLPNTLDAPDRAQLERLWQLLRASINDVLLHKERLLSVELEGVDVFEGDRVITFVQRIVKMFAPIVSEISRRSPNPLELSLKHENDSGRREEIYLRKQDLVSKLEPLGPSARSIFAPFALTREESSIDIAIEE